MKKIGVSIAIVVLLPLWASLGHADVAQSDGKTIRVMTFNILHGGTRRGQPLSQTAKVIRAAKADVVGLQEVGENADIVVAPYPSDHRAVVATFTLQKSPKSDKDISKKPKSGEAN